MAVRSFAFLKKKDVQGGLATTSHHDNVSQASQPSPVPVHDVCDQGVQGDQGLQVGNRPGLKLIDLIAKTRFCYGCPQFSIDAPETEKEQGWCLRELKESDGDWKHEWKRITRG
ncbi:MAG: hypothetical protein U9N19_00500, partial [Thermodesulfobacteriota bacterium]|nr:hypothetical protein [Thermodesulfobacteriota bacterium]